LFLSCFFIFFFVFLESSFLSSNSALRLSNIRYNITDSNIKDFPREASSLSYGPILLMSMRNFT
jgi:hypothetical protein